MMNLLALSLIGTSLFVSGLFSPNPQNNAGKGEQVIVKGGHRAVVVEYGDDIGDGDGNTKVSISSQQPITKGSADEQLSHAAASVAGVAQDVKGKAQEVVAGQDVLHGTRPREVICDAYGKCKDKISEVWSKAKGKGSEAEEVAEEVVDKAKGLVSKAGQKLEEGKESVEDNLKEKVTQAGKAAERAREKVDEVKGKTGEKVRETGEMARESAEKVIDKTGKKMKERKKELRDIARRGKEVLFDAASYVFSVGYDIVKETLGSMMNVMQLLGFAVAYGMSVWVTFIMSHVLAGVLPRQQFGMVQSKIYPVYFKAMMVSVGLALLGHLLGQRGQHFRSKADMLQGYNLLSSLLFVSGNLMFLEPRATKVMFNRMKLEKEEGRGRDTSTAPTRVMETALGDIPTATTTTIAAVTTTSADTTIVPTTTTTSVGRSENEAKSKLAKLDDRLRKLNSYSSFLNILTLMGLTWHLVYLSQRVRATC